MPCASPNLNRIAALSVGAMLLVAGCSSGTTTAPTTVVTTTTQAAATTKATTTTAVTTTTEAPTTTTTNAGDLGVNASGSTSPGGVKHIEMSTALTVPGYTMSALDPSLVTELQSQIAAQSLLAGHTLEIGTVVATTQAGEAVVLVLVHLDATLAGADNQVKVLQALAGANAVTQRNVGNVVGVNYEDTGQFDFAGVHADTLVLALAPTAASRDAFMTALVAAHADL